MNHRLLFILLFSLGVLPSVHAQSVGYVHNSAGNRTSRAPITAKGVGPGFVADSTGPGSKASDTVKVIPAFVDSVYEGIPDSLLTWDKKTMPLVLTREERIRYYEANVRRFDRIEKESRSEETTERRGRSRTADTTYFVGAIPLQEGVSPSGARTYEIPIPVASGFALTPSISVGYNSLAGEGWVGYGWDIHGISTISLTNHNEYYHGSAAPASTTEMSPVFSLDGSPLVTNSHTETSPSYSLETATGHILAAPLQNEHHKIGKFNVLYPDGSHAVFGRTMSYQRPIQKQ